MSLKRARFAIPPRGQVELTEELETNGAISEAEQQIIERVGSTLAAYRRAMKELLKGKYAILKDVAPTYMTDACCGMAFLCPDGILVRYDLKKTPEQKGFVGILEQGTLTSMAPQLSGSFVHCPIDPDGYNPGEQVVTITLSAVPADGSGPARDFITHRLYALARRSASGFATTQTNRRPVPLIGIRNEFDVRLLGELMSEQAEAGQRFLVRSRIKLPLGWEAIEIYPPYDRDVWNPELAPQWAESDLLFAVVQRNLADTHFRGIDPHAQARKLAAQLLEGFEKLLEGPEEPLHQYIKANPHLLNPTHVRSWSKVQLGARITDFVFREASGDYLLVELEKPARSLFRKDGQQHEELTHALDQVTDWRRYLEDNLTTVQRELGLDGISANPRSLVVIGRSIVLNEELRRKLVTMENERPRLKIMTYDDLLANAKATFENILGPIWDPGPNAEVYFLPQGR